MACPRAARFILLLLAFAVPVRAAEPSADQVRAKAVAALFDGIREETLPNGLHVYLKPVPESPTVTIMTVYRVGSADEELSQTGLSHYLEHLMFKGTDKLKPGDIDKLTRRAGGHNNAYTTNDFTNFHFDMPADHWTVALEIEADRMRNLRIDEAHEFEQEKGAVISELKGNEDEPWDLEGKALAPLLFGEKTPYGHPIIGERAHVEAATAAIIKAHYDKWYHPNNASLVIVGGFDPEKALARIKELFSPISAGKLPPRQTVAPVKRSAPVSKSIPSKFDVDRLVMGFNTVRVGEPADYTLDVIEHLLSNGKTGRLYRRLVLEKEVAGEVTCSNQTGRYPGWFSIQLEVMKGTDPKKAEQALLEELRKLADEPLDEAELRRVKRGILAQMVFSLEGVHELADSIVNAVAQADVNYRKTYSARLDAVTAKDIQDVARTYLDPNKRVVAWSVPEKKEKADPGKAGQARRRAPAPFRQKRESSRPATDRVDLTKTKRVVLPNGLTVLLLENRRLPIFYAEAYVKKVRLYEPAAKSGLAMLVGSLLEEGTDKHDEKEIAHLIEDVGGTLAMAGTGGHVKVLTPDRKMALGLLLECLSRPAFPKAAVKRLKEHLMSEIEDADDQPGTRAQEAFYERVYGDHPLSRPGHGSPESVEKLTPEDCDEFHKKVFVPNNTILAVVGDFDTEAVVGEITTLTAGWKRRELPELNLPAVPMSEKFVQKVLPMESAAQVNLYLGHPGVRRSNPDYYKLLVMDNVLGVGSGFTDRLSSKLRDRNGLAYTVTAAITGSATEEPGVFQAFVGTYPDKFLLVKKMLLEEIEAFRASPPTAEEVADAKTFLLGTLPFHLQTNADLADQLLTIERYNLGLNYLDTFRKAIAEVTPEDVHAVAKKYLHPDKMALIAAGPIDAHGKPLAKEKD